MNEENVQKAINIVDRAIARNAPVDMRIFQRLSDAHPFLAQTEEELIHCGTAVCFSGLVAVSHEWNADGGTVSAQGAAVFKLDGDPGCDVPGNHAPDDSMAKWLGVSLALAEGLIACDEFSEDNEEPEFYRKPFEDITLHDVRRALLCVQKIPNDSASDYDRVYKLYHLESVIDSEGAQSPRPVCHNCGSHNLIAFTDTGLRWHATSQEWMAADVNEIECEDCLNNA